MRTKAVFVVVRALLVFLILGGHSPFANAAPVNALIAGEIGYISIDNRNDPWSGGTIVVEGAIVFLPRNLLIDLPANRLTLKQLFDQAPAACIATGETGLAKGDRCNSRGTGGFATIAANVTNGGNTIAGDVLIEKGRALVSGPVTFINYTDGYLRVNGTPGDPNTGDMIRFNDPTGRHSVQQGLGCLPGTSNCSPDIRFGVDPDNYIIAFDTGYPACLPSTAPRQFVDVLDFNGNGITTELLTAQATSSGAGDILCPDTNRSINNGQPVDDSRRFAPIQLGDDIRATGNFETINCVGFVSAHTVRVLKALFTKTLATQPDYMIINQALIEAPGFQDQKIQAFYSGSTTRAPADVVIWSVHNDPASNLPHEFLLATTLGCDAAAGVGSCTAKGVLPPVGMDIFSISHIVDFRLLPTAPLSDPCAHLRADVRNILLNICPAGGTFAEQFAVLSPLPRQIHARTGQKLANPGLLTLDVRGNPATNGQYFFQMGVGLGSILFPDFAGINLNLAFTPFSFDGMPWNNDRRLSPGGCIGPCETTPQPLSPFPFSGLDPRTQAPTPTGPYIDPNYNNGILTRANNRVLSYVSGTPIGGKYNFNGNTTILAWPPIDPPALPTPVIPPIEIHVPVVQIISFPVSTATRGRLYSYQTVATNPFCGALTYSLDLAPAGMTINATGLIQWTPAPAQMGVNPVTVRVTDAGGIFDTQSFGIVASRAVVHNDFDRDGKTDIAVWRGGDGSWHILGSSDGGATSTQWGTLNDQPVPGDYDGDGITDLAVWRPGDGFWYIFRSSDGAVSQVQWGIGSLGDVPVPGDYDGDEKTDIAVWRPGDGFWYIRRSSDGAVSQVQWGIGSLGDVPVPGDYDGDGKTDIAIWRPGDGIWYILRSSDGAVIQTQWGIGSLGDVPVPGDYDGDGKTDIAIWRPGDGFWYILRSLDGAVTQTQWGSGSLGDVPVPGDYDGDRKTDIGVYRPATGEWNIIPGTGVPYVIHWGGGPLDVPIK